MQYASLPNFLIIGAARSGTSSLYDYLSQHPEVFMPDMKEPHFFSGLSDFITSRDEYKGLFKQAYSVKAIGEGSTSYLFVQGTARRIYEELGQVKIIASLRNPVDRAFSNWKLAHAHSKIEKLSFEDALEAEQARYEARQDLGFWPGLMYFRTGLYSQQVKEYLDVFGADNVKVFIFEEFILQPLSHCRSLYRFLGIEPDFVPVIRRKNVSHQPAVQFLYDLVSPPPPVLLSVYRHLPSRLKPLIYTILSRLHRLNRKSEPDNQTISRELRAKLFAMYKGDIEELGKLLGRDFFQWWKV